MRSRNVVAEWSKSVSNNSNRNIDEEVARKFIDYAKTGESVKSAWMLANNYFTDNGGFSTGYNWCVLTHSGNVQYSRFEGFPGTTYTRPGSSSTSILRFSRTYPNGTPQVAASSVTATNIEGLTFTTDTNLLNSTEIPDYYLKSSSSKINVKEDAPVMVLRDDKVVSTVSGEIGDEPVNFTKDDAKIKAEKWAADIYVGLNVKNNKSKLIEVSPIKMAEVNLAGDSSKEVEEDVAYVVAFTNTYKDIPVKDNFYSVVVDNKGISTSTTNWSDFKEVKTNEKANDFKKAVKIVSDTLSNTKYASKIVKNTELAFTYNSESDNYEPTWIFNMNDNKKVEVTCFNGKLSIKQ